MIDFVSTRPDIDRYTASCAQLLAAVIAQAVRDACEPPSKKEKELEKNLNEDSITALLFLFSDDPVFAPYQKLMGPSKFKAYSELIGMSHEALRNELLTPEGGGVDYFQRRTLRIRLQWLKNAVEARNEKSATKKRSRRG